ncbi:hypothetical protein [Enterobacter cancerogenus]
MSRMGWKRSASFMTRWLNSPAWKCPESWKDGRGCQKVCIFQISIVMIRR